MKYKLKSKASILIILIIVAATVLIAVKLGGFSSTRSAVRIGSFGSEGRSNWSGNYAMLDGIMQKTIYPDGDILNLSVKTESGTISIEIKNADGDILFQENQIGTETFEIQVTGKVTVRIEAEKHKGSFDIA